MKRIFIMLLILLINLTLLGCDNATTNQTNETILTEDSGLNQQLNYIYNLAIEAGEFDGTYEEWLETVRGPQGIPGEDGQEVELQVSDYYIQWRYTEDENWVNLIDLISLTGSDGQEVLFQVFGGYIQWKYENNSTWNNLIALEALVGPQGESGSDGQEIEFQVSNNFIQWKYVNDSEWKSLIELQSLMGPPGEDGQEVVFQVFEDHIQWRYINDIEWKNLIDIDSLIGPKGNQGIGVESFIINEFGELIVTLTDGNEQNLGVIRTHTVYFRTDRGPIYDILDVNPGTIIDEPQTPVKQGYVFTGWYVNDVKISFPYTFESNNDLSIYAKWTVNSFEYQVELNNEVTITGYKGEEIDLIIPSEIDGLPVTKIDDNSFQENDFIETLNFEKYSNIKEIGYQAFESASQIKEVHFPSSLEIIDDQAFANSNNIKDISFDSDCMLNTIGEKAFYMLYQLREIYLPSQLLTIDDYAFAKTNLDVVDFGENSQLKTIGKYAFSENNILSQLMFPASLTHIGDFAFKSVVNLETVSFDNNSQLIYIGEGAFHNNGSLRRFEMPETLEEIGEFAFYNTLGLGNIVVPKSVQVIGRYAFSNGTSTIDKAIYVQLTSKPSEWHSDWNGNQTVIWNIFDYGNYNDFDYVVTSNNTANIIGYKGSEGDITIPSSIGGTVVHEIGSRSFQNNDVIKNVMISEGIEIIGERAFYGYNTILSSIYIPASITRIERGAFKDKASLTNLTLAENSELEYIGLSAFEFTSITTFIIPSSVIDIDSSAFSNAKNITFYAQATSKPVGWDSNWNSYNSPVVWDIVDYSVTEDLSYVVKSDNTIAILGQSVLSSKDSIIIPGSIDSNVVNEISARAFMFSAELKEIYIHDNIQIIGIDAFKSTDSLTIFVEYESKPLGWDSNWNSSGRSVIWGYIETIDNEEFIYAISTLDTATIISVSESNINTNIIIPGEINGFVVDQIVNEAFKDNLQIINVTIPSTITSIAEETFSGASNLETIIFEEGIQLDEIGDQAFQNAIALTTITIPDTVVSLGHSSFRNLQSLEMIIIPNSVLEIGDFAFYQCDILVIYAEALAKPDGWSSNWKAYNTSVEWGYIET